MEPGPLRAQCVELAIKSVTGQPATRELLTTGVRVTEELMAADDFERAARLTTSLASKARAARDREMAERLAGVRRRGSEMFPQYQKAKAALETLKTRPGDPEANLIAARYLCFAKEDWERGISMLALGSDAGLKAIAVQELKAPNQTADQMRLGDAWWQWAESAKGHEASAAKRHAASWYHQAEPQLSGLAKARIEKRLAEAPLAGPAVSARPGRVVNLIPLVDLKQDVLHGTWEITKGELVCKSSHFVPRVQIPYIPPEQYDFRVVYTSSAVRNHVVQIVPKADKSLAWAFGNRDGDCHFEFNPRGGANPAAVKLAGFFRPNVRYESVVKVRNDGVQAFLNGKVIVQHKTDFSDVGENMWYKVRDKRLLAVGCDDPTVFHTVELVEISGHGKPARAD